MNWLKKLLNGALNGFKSDLYREIGRAQDKLRDGRSTQVVVDALHSAIADLLAKARLPLPLGAILASILMMVDWDSLAATPSEDAIKELERLRKRIEGARL